MATCVIFLAPVASFIIGEISSRPSGKETKQAGKCSVKVRNHAKHTPAVKELL